ncbi:NAD(P)H-dependent oxidoreductase [Ramlibacter humi]|uniref:NAD(P)H-dependent oxidoreductase n=1 Tax=Ramlibacter humi TaxID=2530451 RepID=A0A4Z0CEG4_9BURK|nr:NAD(P)H-dependent oxidoreductase [Ramlibacter humi]
MKILALCGSLRRQSRSRALLQATRQLAGDRVAVDIFEGLGDLPLFNPDLEDDAPAAVRRFWQAVSDSDALLIASPEYAHGVTGTIKNALDWLVGYVPFAGKPVAVFNPSHRAEHADAALRETLATMAAPLVPGACVRIPVTAGDWDVEGICADPRLSAMIDAALQAIASFQPPEP